MNKFQPIILIACLLFAGCTAKPTKVIDAGSVTDGVFTNDYFGMSVKLPEDWALQNKNQQGELMERGEEMYAGDDRALKTTVKAAMQQTVAMFTLFRHQVGAPVSFNQSLICLAERIAHMPGIKNGSDYHYHAKKAMEAGQMNFQFPDKIYSETVAGKEFHVMPVVMDIGIMKVRQHYYAARFDDYALVMILSFTSDEEEKSLMDILNTLKFSV